jgi:DNA replication and repair protein RecF
MRLLHLSLTNFRNYSRLELSLPDGAVLLHGANAQGKTSLLEAVYYLATSRSPWTNSDKQLLNWRCEHDPMPFARISAEVQNRTSAITKIDITLMKGETGDKFSKVIKVNGAKKRATDLLGEINVVMFLPQDLAIVEGTPADRRRYLNITLSQTDKDYARALQTYDKALTQRNALLRLMTKRQTNTGELDYWNDQIIESGSVIISGRQRLLRELEGLAQRVHGDLTAGAEVLELHYHPSFEVAADEGGQMAFNIPGLDIHRQLSPAEIAPQFRAALEKHHREEVARGVTLIGPQRDELRFSLNGHDLGLYGSRGQARTAVMAIKLAELDWMRSTIGEYPVLLLDEFIAELDAERRRYLLDHIDGAQQSILTTTEPDIFSTEFLNKAAVWRVRAGQIDTEKIDTEKIDTTK